MLMQGSVSVAANAVSANVLAGELHEFLNGPANVIVSACGSATGLNCSFLAAGVSLIDDQAINTQNRFPVLPDDILDAQQLAGGRLVLKFRNTTGGALTAFWRVDVD